MTTTPSIIYLRVYRCIDLNHLLKKCVHLQQRTANFLHTSVNMSHQYFKRRYNTYQPPMSPVDTCFLFTHAVDVYTTNRNGKSPQTKNVHKGHMFIESRHAQSNQMTESCYDLWRQSGPALNENSLSI